jgi:DNA-binding NtrC family response regulator
MDRVAPSDPHKRLRGVSEAALAMLMAYDWPGNIRQLENAVFRASVLCDGDMLTPEEFPQIRAQVEGTVDLGQPGGEASAADGDAGQSAPTRAVGSPEGSAGAGWSRFGTVQALDDRGNVRSLAAVELEMIKLAIEHYGGQMSEVARRLGIGRSTLYRKLKEYGIDPEVERFDRMAS